MNPAVDLDHHSLLILRELQRDGRQTIQQLAQRVGLSTTPCWNRVREMERSGVIRGYTALIDREKVGLGLRVVAELNLSPHTEEIVRRFEQAVAHSPQIVQCLSATGQADYILTVLVEDIKRYEQLLHETIFRLPGVNHVRSSIVLKEVKPLAPLPLHEGGAAPARAAPRRRTRAAAAESAAEPSAERMTDNRRKTSRRGNKA